MSSTRRPTTPEAFDSVCEYLEHVVLADFPPIIDTGWLAEDLANRILAAPYGISEALEHAAIMHGIGCIRCATAMRKNIRARAAATEETL